MSILDNIEPPLICRENGSLHPINQTKDFLLKLLTNIGFKEVHGPDSIWKQTSIRGNIRGQYAVPGMMYNEELDLFLHKKVPFDSWTLDMEHYTWEPPIPQPTLTEEELSGGKRYVWDENIYQNDTNDPKIQGWILIDPSEDEPVE